MGNSRVSPNQSMSNPFFSRESRVSSIVPVRLIGNIFWQGLFTPSFDPNNDISLQGKTILVTGGGYGIGLHITRNLVQRGAHVIISSRNEEKLKEAVSIVKSEDLSKGGNIDYLPIDLSDLVSVKNFVSEFQKKFPNVQLDILIENAGLWPASHSVSPQGYEIAFATNVLGHHLLLRSIQKHNLLKESGKIVVLTGDIYATVNDCTPDFAGANDGGEVAYSRSKLGVNWLFFEFHRRFPNVKINLVHPGVVSTTLAGHSNVFWNNIVCITPTAGAQTPLLVATAPDNVVENGAYYHNTFGKVILPKTDHAVDEKRSLAFWELVEGIIASFL